MKVKSILPLLFVLCHIGFSQDERLDNSLNVAPYMGLSSRDNRNVNHTKGTFYQDLKRGTVVIFIGKGTPENIRFGSCTGTLMNTVTNLASQDYFILTSNHCFNEQIEGGSIYLSFDYEVPYSKLRGNAKRDGEIAKLEGITFDTFEKVVVDEKSDIALLRVDHTELDEIEKSIFKNAYAVGYNLHPSYAIKNFINISHPTRDHKKLFVNPSGSNFNFNDQIRELRGMLVHPGGKVRTFSRDWDKQDGSYIQKGSSGSSLIDISNHKYGVAAIYVASNLDLKPGFSYLENAWRISPNRSKSLQDFLDPENTWISQIPGGYFNEALPNEAVDYNLDFSKRGEFKVDFKLDIATILVGDEIGKTREDFLGNGLLPTHISDDIYLTINPKDDPNYLLYGIFYGKNDTPSDAFSGNAWSLGDFPSRGLPTGESVIYPSSILNNDLLQSQTISNNLRTNVSNYIIQRLAKRSNSDPIATVKKMLATGAPTLNATITLRTLSGNPSDTKVRAIKFPNTMPYNAVELFEPLRFSNLWAFKGYPDSRGGSSSELFVNQVSTGILCKTSSSLLALT